MRYIKLYDDILVFTKLVDNMNFGKTAVELNTTQSTVSRRIKSLEDALGFMLLERDTRKLKLTEQGMQLYFSFREQERFLVDQITKIKEDRKHNRGRFSLSLPFSLSHGLLTPLLARFLQEYPEISVETLYGVSDRHTFNDVDVEISAQKPKVEDSEFYLLETRKIQAYCSPAYVEKYGLPVDISDLTSGKHFYMGVTDKNDDGVDDFIYINNAITGAKTQLRNNDRQFISNSPIHAAELATVCEMIVWGWDEIFSEYIAQNKLVKVLPECYFVELPIYLIKRNKNSLVVDTFTHFIRTNIRT